MAKEFELRVAEWRRDLESALAGLYGDEAGTVGKALVERARAADAARPSELVDLDRARAASPYWYQGRQRIGYMAYVDRLGGDLAGVRRRIPYLTELGVDTLHLLSLLEPRAGENDGGYAIRDYHRPDPRLGTVEDLSALIADLRANGISLCVDFVLNHTSDDHEWARAAVDGSEYHQALYRMYPDRTEPDAWEATLPEVFPNLAPGSFTWNDELQRWVWTTFREFQWDLDWSNPDVMLEIADLALGLANLGVEILRLDAIAFTWKRLGTNCQNQPEAHLIAQALRAVLAMAAPSTVLLAEAIVAPDDLVAYLGRHEHGRERRECELAYHNQLMVQGWSMLASGRADLARHAISRLADIPGRSTWFTYVRCHDDIGWAIDDADAAHLGLSGAGHREFLAAFYRGDFWQSFARGTPFGTNTETGDERTSGMSATLAGVTAALGADDPDALDLAIRRVLLLYGIAFGYGGIPIIYMGDELGQQDDMNWAAGPTHGGDSRWTHRPAFDDDLAALRHDTTTPTGRMWSGIRHLVQARTSCLALHDDDATIRTFDPGFRSVFAWHRSHPRFGELVGLANVGDDTVDIVARPDTLTGAVDVLAPDDRHPWRVGPLQVRWITADANYATVPAPPPA
ncbi:MAG: alpha-amylase family protein [Ilumatobacteraceae bacterium]|nr:alpha-amylase family protein [Ilumatobacteraceae bacterium]